MILLSVGLGFASLVTINLWCFDSVQMSLKPNAIDGSIIQKKVDLMFIHLYARDAHS